MLLVVAQPPLAALRTSVSFNISTCPFPFGRLSSRDHFPLAAFAIATMPVFTASGRSAHASFTVRRSASTFFELSARPAHTSAHF